MCTTTKAMYCMWLPAAAGALELGTAPASRAGMLLSLKVQAPTNKTTTTVRTATAILPLPETVGAVMDKLQVRAITIRAVEPVGMGME
jgi:hypothetical protein